MLKGELGEAKRQSEVSMELDNANGSLDILEKRVSELQTRLSDVLKPSQTKKEPAETPEEPSRVPLAYDIRSVANRIVIQTGRIANIIDELEL